MKKKLLVLLSLILCFSSIFSLSGEDCVKQSSMALYGVADSKSDTNYFVNPALVYGYQQNKKFIFSTGYSDYYTGNSPLFISKPETYLRTQFVSKTIALAIDVDVHSVNEAEYRDNDYFYTLQRDVTFSFNAATGYKDFGIGIGINGGSSMIQKDVSNLLYQSVLGKFQRMDESQFLNIKAGMMYQLNHFSFGIMADKLFSYEGSAQRLYMDKALDYISGGVYWAQSKYARRGRLNEWVFNAGAECLNIFNNAERTINAGAEATLQLASEYTVSVRTGLSILTADASHPRQSLGLGARLDRFDIGLYTEFPFLGLEKDKDSVSVSLCFSLIN